MDGETSQDSLWTSMLAEKLVTSHNDILSVVTKVSKQLTEVQLKSLQLPEVVSTLNMTIALLKESGKKTQRSSCVGEREGHLAMYNVAMSPSKFGLHAAISIL